MENKRPTGRKKNVTGTAKPIGRKGDGLGTGPVGNSRPDNFSGVSHKIDVTGSSNSGRGIKRSGGPLTLIAIVAALLIGGPSLFGGNDSGYDTYVTPTPAPTPVATPKPSSPVDFGITPQNFNSIAASSAATEVTDTNTDSVDTAVAAGARDKRTAIRGDGKDQITIMIYMCGTDLESRSSMATRDLVEMTKSKLSQNVRIIVYTGGCTRWNNSVVSSTKNQIYEVKEGGLDRLAADMGSGAMTNPETLATFIQWCAKRYPANRNELILWDHGGGSVSGYGYDEKYARSGSMSLAGIDQALKAGGVTFDFVGFDACLMATLETGLMLDRYADYMIASEETEPGIGWYYTNWLNKLAANPGMSTVELGKNIVDDFVQTCASQTRGQSATLSVVDLAELAHTVPTTLKEFSLDLTNQIKSNNYQQISSARNGTREFARSTQIDQIDLIHFAKKLGTKEGRALAEALQGAIKYNRTSSDMSDAYGISIYFPYRKTSKVTAACTTYDAIGMDESYSECIRAFANVESCGQAASNVGGYSIPSILTGGYGSSTSGDMEMINELLNAFLGGGASYYSGYVPDRSFVDTDAMSDYIANNSFDATELVWTENRNGDQVISLSEEQWNLIEGLEYNVFYDDGEGYIDLGMDVVYDFDDEGNLLAPEDNTWLAVNGQPVAFYHEYTVGDTIRGYIPALLNGEQVKMLVLFDEANPYGAIVGVQHVYDASATETVAKGDPALTDSVPELDEDWTSETAFWQPGDQIDFIADYYTYAGVYQDTFIINLEPMTVSEEMIISDVDLGDANLRKSFRFTDLYQQHYWTPALEN